MKEQAVKLLLYIFSLLIDIILITPLIKLDHRILFCGILIGVVIMYSMLKHTIYRDSLIKSIINFAWVLVLAITAYLFVTANIILLTLFWVLIFLLTFLLFRQIKQGKTRIGIEIFVEFVFYCTSFVVLLILMLVYAIFDVYILEKLGDYEKVIGRFIQLYFIYAGLVIPYQFKMWVSSIISIDESIYSIEEQTRLLNLLIEKYCIDSEYKVLKIDEVDMQKVEMFINQKVLQALTGTSNFEYYSKIGIDLRLTSKGNTIKVNSIPHIGDDKISFKDEVKTYFSTVREMPFYGIFLLIFFGTSALYVVYLLFETLKYIFQIAASNKLIIFTLIIAISIALLIVYVIEKKNKKFNNLWNEKRKVRLNEIKEQNNKEN